MKKYSESWLIQKLIIYVFLLIYFLLALTWRKKIIYHPEVKELREKNQLFSIACWHQNNITNLWMIKIIKTVIMSTPSFDGRLTAAIVQKFGGSTAWGSSRKNPIAALKAIVRLSKETHKCPVITVDGPIGPKYIPKPGILGVAKLAQIPIVPFGTYIEKGWILKKTWDLTTIPKPFSKIIYYFDKPIKYDFLDIKEESSLIYLKERLDDAQRKARESV